MQKNITIYTVTSLDNAELSRSFTTKRLAEDAKKTLQVFGIEVEISKETRTIEL